MSRDHAVVDPSDPPQRSASTQLLSLDDTFDDAEVQTIYGLLSAEIFVQVGTVWTAFMSRTCVGHVYGTLVFLLNITLSYAFLQ